MPEADTLDEARRVMEICNACRYCEGFCAVFPAMERERAFRDGDLAYLANLCHNCRGCYYACQYAPPHPFDVNVPRVFAALREESWADFAWPAPLARAFGRNATVVAGVTALALILALALGFAIAGRNALTAVATGPGAYYRVVPWAVMAAVASATFVFSLASLWIAGARFRCAAGGTSPWTPQAIARGLSDALTLKNLGGGGDGCNDRDEAFSNARRRLHHAMAYGFILCFASTCSAALEDYAWGIPAPYPIASAPVILGLLGGAGILVGAAGLAWIKLTQDSRPGVVQLRDSGFAILALLWTVAASGVLLLAFRATAAMGVLLVIHLGFVLALFLLLPYSGFAHVAIRTLALIRNASEADRPLQGD